MRDIHIHFYFLAEEREIRVELMYISFLFYLIISLQFFAFEFTGREVVGLLPLPTLSY
jgi:hypothetical protein